MPDPTDDLLTRTETRAAQANAPEIGPGYDPNYWRCCYAVDVPALRERLAAAEAELAAERPPAGLKYRCGCPAVRSDLVHAFCPEHRKMLEPSEEEQK